MNAILAFARPYRPLPASLTPRQLAIVEAVRSYTKQHGYAPSYREAGLLCGLPISTVKYQMGVLRQLGQLTYADNVARSVRLA